MATLATGNLSGGQKKASGCTIGAGIATAWEQVRDDCDKSTNWVLCGYVPASSKTNIDVVATGPGGLNGLKAEVRSPSYDAQCLFGGFRDDSDGKFVHFTYVGHATGAMTKGRASLHKNAVLNEIEGCVREHNMIQAEDDASDQPGSSSGASATLQRQISAKPATGSKADNFASLGDAEFSKLFGMSRGDFEELPKWKQGNAKKEAGLF